MEDEELPEDEEEILVYVEFEDCADANMFSNKQLRLDMIGLDTEHPIMQVNGRFFEGTYEDAVGTYMFFDKNENATVEDPVFDTMPTLKYFAKTRKLLKMQRVFVKHHTEVFGDSEHGDCVPNLKILREAGVPTKYQEDALKFWKKIRSSRMDALNAYLEKQRIREEKKSLGIALDSESDEENPFAIYNPKSESLKANKSKNRKEEEQSKVKKFASKKGKEKLQTINENLTNNTEEELQEEQNNENDERMEVDEDVGEKSKNFETLEKFEKFDDPLSSEMSENMMKEEVSKYSKNIENLRNLPTTSRAEENSDSQDLRMKPSSVKVLARKTKISFPSTSVLKKRKKRASVQQEKRKNFSKGGRNKATINEDIEKKRTEESKKRHKETEKAAEEGNKLQNEDKREVSAENVKSIESQEERLRNEESGEKEKTKQQVARNKLNEVKVKVENETNNELQSEKEGSMEIENNEGKSEGNVKMESKEAEVKNMIESAKRLRKQERRREKLQEISERLKAIANNYKDSDAKE